MTQLGCWKTRFSIHLIINRVALAKQRDNVLGGVRPSVRPFVCPSVSVRSHS